MPLRQVHVAPLPLDRFGAILTDEQLGELERAIERAQSLLDGRVVWSVNSTARGGGVAELLGSLIAYTRGAGVDARWVVIAAGSEFFAITKRLHNHLHGAPGDGGPLGEAEQRVYAETCAANARELVSTAQPDDVVLLHDPQTAGLVRPLKEAGIAVVWRCHVGLDEPNDLARSAWRFLLPHVVDADAYVFSRRAFAWDDLDRRKLVIIQPSIDAFSPKNQDLDPRTTTAILQAAGLTADESNGQPTFVHEDGTPGRVDRHAELVEEGHVPPGAPLVAQVSRWDRLKDPAGLLSAFVERVAPRTEAHLVLAGPVVAAVSDDPEGGQVLREVTDRWRALPEDLRGRVHLASLPMEDSEENAAMVNALQRRADVVVQKSLAEGFGLTVAEAMWKGRPVVGSRVGGIQDQIVDGDTGVLVDPADLSAFGEAVVGLVENPDLAARLGAEARNRVRDSFLGPRHLREYVDLFEGLLKTGSAPQAQALGPRWMMRT